MKSKPKLIIAEKIEQRIFLIRNKKIMIDYDLAELYQVPTFRLNEQVKRNLQRFPEDFMFRINRRERDEVIANCDSLQTLKFSPSLPYAFTEQGVAMLSSVLNSERAIAVNIHIMRTFTKLRELMIAHKDLHQRINELERKYDSQFRVVFDTIRKLIDPSPTKKKLPIGFHMRHEKEGSKEGVNERRDR